MPSISGGTVSAAIGALAAFSAQDEREQMADATAGPDAAALGVSPGTMGCRNRLDGTGGRDDHDVRGNVRVNQDCTFRRQAEEVIIYNPAQPTNLLAGQNDSRVGFNQCGIDWSTDNGQHWGDLLPPFRQKLNNPAAEEPRASDPNRHTILGGPGTFHTYDAGSDPIVAFDSLGTGYFGCVAFDVASDASMLYVTASPAGAQGTFFFNLTTFSRRFVVAEDNNPAVFHDKPFLAADTFAGSPNRDNVYVTWTVFKSSPNCGPQPNPGAEERYCSSPIFGSMTTDHGRHWSTPEEISGTADAVCFFGNSFDPKRAPNACDFDQGSDPTVLPNGDLEVIFNNGNTASTNPNGQQLGVHCKPTGKSETGTAHLNCASPAIVGADVSVGEPKCDFGRGPEECIPGAFIRTNDFPRIAKNVNDNHLYATWQDYRNGEFDIQLSVSDDGGLTWKERGTVNPDRGEQDHYFPAIDIAKRGRQAQDDREGDDDNRGNGGGDQVGVSYYRTKRVSDENVTPPGGSFQCPRTACQGSGDKNSDYVLAGGSGVRTPYQFTVVSPPFAPPDGIQAGFNGDYTGLTINRGTEAHPIWSDTRNTNPYPENGVVHDEDVFTDTLALPVGRQEDDDRSR